MAISRGSSWSKSFKVIGRTTGTPKTLGRLSASFRDEAGVTPVLVLTTENGGITKPDTGEFTITMNSTQTELFTEDSYLFAVYDVDDDNKRILKGTITFEDQI